MTLLTAKEAADKLRVHPITIARMVKAGLLVGVRIGMGRGQWRVTEESLAAHIAAGGAHE